MMLRPKQLRRHAIPMMQTYWYYIRAKYYDPKHCRMEQAFAGPYPDERTAMEDGNKKYSALAGSEFTIVKSRSRDRNVARNENRNVMVDEGEADVAEVLNMRFRRS